LHKTCPQGQFFLVDITYFLHGPFECVCESVSVRACVFVRARALAHVSEMLTKREIW